METGEPIFSCVNGKNEKLQSLLKKKLILLKNKFVSKIETFVKTEEKKL